ncbi:hypothetical protein DFH09DRAFT_1091012 [Mycena vulgaris]|nr:hypothetical protein DFH09DRAFT_1091012 [Mycena vulgaris]
MYGPPQCLLLFRCAASTISSLSYPDLFGRLKFTSNASSNASSSVPPIPFPNLEPPDDPVVPPQEYPFTFSTFSVDVHPEQLTPGSYQYDLASGICSRNATVDSGGGERQNNRASPQRAPKEPVKEQLGMDFEAHLCLQPGIALSFQVPQANRSGPKDPQCQCRLAVKTYPGIQEVLGRYNHEHSHPTCDINARFVRIPAETQVPGNIHTEGQLDQLGSQASKRNEFIAAADSRQSRLLTRFNRQKDIEAETIRLDIQDGQSTKEWVKNLRKRGGFFGFKGSSDASPPTPSCSVCKQNISVNAGRNGAASLQASTPCRSLPRHELLHGHGMPAVVWMLASNGKKVTID